MLLPDGTVLQHQGVPYDPRKAHEYYLRTRKLHPRQRGSHTYTVRTADGKTVKLTTQQLIEQRTYAAHRVAQIKAKLTTLSADLHKRLEAARKREADAKKPPTAAEKAKAAREAKKYRDSHHQKLANSRKKASSSAAKAPAHKTETVASLKVEITQTKASLHAAVAKQRELANAKKNG